MLWLRPETPSDDRLGRYLAARGFPIAGLDDPSKLDDFARGRGLAAVIADSDYLDAAAAFRDAQANLGAKPIPLLVVSRTAGLGSRLNALRRRADAFFGPPLEPETVMAKLTDLLELAPEATPYKVMVVDDDPTQAHFATAILGKQGMEVHAVTESLKILDALHGFRPELILMDVYMPDASGVELTTIIREQQEFMDIPIVYLSAEQDPEKQLDALSAGGEDFLTKPIQPRFLISTVRNRIERARQLRARALAAQRRHSDPAEVRQNVLAFLERTRDTPELRRHATGLLYVEIDNPVLLLDRLSLGGVDRVMNALAETAKGWTIAADRVARFGDFCLIVIAQRAREADLVDLAKSIRRGMQAKEVAVGGNAVRCTVSIGLRTIHAHDADAAHLIEAAIRACHQARADATGIHVERGERPQPRAGKTLDPELLERVADTANLQLLYQPVVPLQREHEPLYQCLLRLRMEQDALLAAGEFLPQVEHTGKILKLDRWVILKALLTLRKLRSKQDARQRLIVSQSVAGLRDLKRIDWTRQTLEKVGVGADGLILEFPYPAIAADLGRARELLEMAKGIGLGISLNNTGELDSLAGSLNLLPADFIKLSVNQIRAFPDTWSALVESAHGQGQRVIVSLIEHPDLLGQLWSSEVDYIQGNFIQPPGEDLAYDFTGAILG